MIFASNYGSFSQITRGCVWVCSVNETKRKWRPPTLRSCAAVWKSFAFDVRLNLVTNCTTSVHSSTKLTWENVPALVQCWTTICDDGPALYLACFDWWYLGHTHETRYLESMLVWRWSNVVNGGPMLNQHWFNILYLLGSHIRWTCSFNVGSLSTVLGQH